MSNGAEPRPRFQVAPLAPIALAVAAGIAADRLGPGCATSTWASMALTSAVLAGLADDLSRRMATMGLIVGLMALGGGWHHWRWSDLDADDLARASWVAARPAWVGGCLIEAPSFRAGTRPDDSGSTRAVLEVDRIRDGKGWRRASGRLQVIVRGDGSGLAAGDPVEAAGRIETPPPARNPGEFSYADYLRAQGVRLRLEVDEPASLWRSHEPPAPGLRPAWNRWLGRARAWSLSTLARGLDPEALPLAAALLLGRREAVDPEVNAAFARTGTTHLLAISGLHLQVLALCLGLALRAIGLPRRVVWLSVAAATIGYALLVGLAPSVARSAAMTVALCLAAILDRFSHRANTLSLAALLTLLINPSALFDIGCQLSFLAVAAIFWGVPAVQAWLPRRELNALDALERRLAPWWQKAARKALRRVWEGLVLSTVVWLAALPLVVTRFHVVSPIGILLNLPLIPVTSAALLAAGLTLGLSAIWVPLGAPAAWACARLLHLTEILVRWGAAQPWGHTFEPGPPESWMLVFYGLLAIMVVLGRAHSRWSRPAWWTLGAWTAWGLWLASGPIRPGAVEADVLAVDHGLAVVIQAEDGRVIVYDCGRMSDPNVGRRVIAPALWSRGVRRIDSVILSHADADHYNALPDLLERFAIKNVYIGVGFATDANPGTRTLLENVRKRGIPIVELIEGDRWSLPGVRFAVRHPPRDWPLATTDNARSLVLDVESNGRHALWTGDLERDGLAALIAQPAPDLDILLAPHHGARAANPDWLYAWARPKLVVASQRAPAPGTTDALELRESRGTPVLRTWQRGAIRLQWKPDSIKAHGFLDPDLQSSISDLPSLMGSSMTWIITIAGFVAGLAASLLLVVIEWGASTLVLSGRRFAPLEPEPSPWQPVAITGSDGTRLAGSWRRAEPATGRTLILLHGFAEDRTEMRGRADALAESGWNALIIDGRSYGQSGGDRTSFGTREADDIRAWIDDLADRVGPTLRVAAWGRSMGAAVVLRAASSDPRIAALILEAPYPDLTTAVGAWLAAVRLPRRLAHPMLRRARRLAGVPIASPSPLDLAPTVPVPVLVIHGTHDRLIPIADARRLAVSFPTPATFHEVVGAKHADIANVAGPALPERVAAFLNEAVLES